MFFQVLCLAVSDPSAIRPITGKRNASFQKLVKLNMIWLSLKIRLANITEHYNFLVKWYQTTVHPTFKLACTQTWWWFVCLCHSLRGKFDIPSSTTQVRQTHPCRQTPQSPLHGGWGGCHLPGRRTQWQRGEGGRGSSASLSGCVTAGLGDTRIENQYIALNKGWKSVRADSVRMFIWLLLFQLKSSRTIWPFANFSYRLIQPY